MRTHGHRAARIDPLDLLQREEVAALDPTRYGLADPGRTYDVDGVLWTRAGAAAGEMWTLERIVRHLRAVYVGNVAYEFMHSSNKTERLWFMHELESESSPGVRVTPSADAAPRLDPTRGRKRRVHALLAQSEVFDRFLQLKFPNLKRYGLEGGESMLPAIDTVLEAASTGKRRDSCASICLDVHRDLCSGHIPRRSRHAAPWPAQPPYWLIAIPGICAFSEDKGRGRAGGIGNAWIWRGCCESSW